jgi:ATP-dependent RNA helicase DHX37/DHR1
LISASVSQSELPSSIKLGSSATLGTGRITSHAERLEKSENLVVRKAFDGAASRRKRRRLDLDAHGRSEDEDKDENEYDNYEDRSISGDDTDSSGTKKNPFASKQETTPASVPLVPTKPMLGSALLNGAPPRVILRKQKSNSVSRKLVSPLSKTIF